MGMAGPERQRVAQRSGRCASRSRRWRKRTLPGDCVIVLNDDNHTTLKQLVKDSGDLYLRPLNGRYPIKPLVAAKATGLVREFSTRFQLPCNQRRRPTRRRHLVRRPVAGSRPTLNQGFGLVGEPRRESPAQEHRHEPLQNTFGNPLTIHWPVRTVRPFARAMGRSSQPGDLMPRLRHAQLGSSMASLLGLGAGSREGK
jgi:hypothetical protein